MTDTVWACNLILPDAQEYNFGDLRYIDREKKNAKKCDERRAYIGFLNQNRIWGGSEKCYREYLPCAWG